MANPNIAKEGEKYQFTEEKQPLPQAKKEGWAKRKREQELRNNVIRKLYKKYGFDDDGNSLLDDKIADEMMAMLNGGGKDKLELFHKYLKEMLPEKAQKHLHGSDEDNPLGLKIEFVKAKKTTND